MEKVLYFLGAGFSAPLGLPICSNFIFRAGDLFRERSGEYAYFKDVFARINDLARVKNYYKSDLMNIEEVFSILEMRAQLRAEPTNELLKRFIIDVISYYTPRESECVIRNPEGRWPAYFFGAPRTSQSLVRLFAANLLGLAVAVASRQGSSLHEHYRLRRLTQDVQYAVVTVNYDRVLEALEGYIAPFKKSDDSEDFRFATGPEATWSHCPLVKLHGDAEERNIVPPTWNKTLHPEMAATWKRAEKLLTEATQIRFLGYSFPTNDVYLQYLLKSSALRNPDLKRIDVVCLDDLDGTVRQRFERVVDFRDRQFRSGLVQDYWTLLAKRIPTSGGYVADHLYRELESAHDEFFATSG